MCEPVSLSLMAASVGLQTVGAIQGASAANAAGKANQQYYDYIAAQNKASADEAVRVGAQKADMAQMKGSQDSAKYARSASEFRGLQRATSAAMGVTSGATAEDIAYDTLTKEGLDEQAIRYNADLAAWSAKTGAAYEAWDYRNQSNLNTMAGVNARNAGKTQAKASLIGGATSIANTLYNGSLYLS